jgi:micrococcal nuclease
MLKFLLKKSKYLCLYSKNEKLGKIQGIAKSKKTGLWFEKNPIAPWEWRSKKM